MSEERVPYNVLHRDLELTLCKLRLAQLDIRDLKEENKVLRDKLATLLDKIENGNQAPCEGESCNDRSSTEYY